MVRQVPEAEAGHHHPAVKPSGAARVLWWCVVLIPIGGPLLFLLPPLLLVALGAAFIVSVDAITDRGVPAPQRLAGLLLSAAIVPATLLAVFMAPPMTATGIAPPGQRNVMLLALAAYPVWIWVCLRVKPRIWEITKKSEWKP